MGYGNLGERKLDLDLSIKGKDNIGSYAELPLMRHIYEKF
jgi:hypothetical protein